MREVVIEKLQDLAITMLDTKNDIDEIDIEKTLNIFIPTLECFLPEVKQLPITVGEREKVISDLEKRYDIHMDMGTMLLDESEYKKWYYSSKSERGTKYWDRYEKYLKSEKKLPIQVISSMDNATEEIMEVLGDPLAESSFSRKGLVIGAVQSGKTSNYTALINKAVDSGYKIIILLTGTIEKLRQQTQERLDEGFVGLDSKELKQNKKNNYIGVGKIDRDIKVFSFTDTSKDFTSSVRGDLASINAPVIFVIKKNKSVLEKLFKWLTRNNSVNHQTGKIDLPLLMIDDEADNASINTNNPDKDPTAINKGIRSIIQQFSKYSYVGFTATPFANIFIDPFLKSEGSETLSEDLFPKDFIYLLEQPSNYVGPYDMYNENGRFHYMIRHNDDMEEILPLSHKNGAIPSSLPKTLRDAVLLFFLSNAIRDLRGQKTKHRSMLVHVSRFISVQNIVTQMIAEYVREVKNSIKNYALLDKYQNGSTMFQLKKLYDKEYSGNVGGEDADLIKENWDQVRKVLYHSVQAIQVKSINSGTASQSLNYDEYEESGLRLIAIGGLSLARGLTLEGLTISYFYRNTKMYDTLMQMGRWFGYRDGYRDLCRLWMSEESEGWYSHIAEATEELRLEIKKMKAQRKRPTDFGLKVRSATDTPLIVTARNKSKATEQIRLQRSLNGQVIETAILPSDLDEIKANYEAISSWVESNKRYYVEDPSELGKRKPTFKDIPKSVVLDLLSVLEYPYMNDFHSDSILLKEVSESASKIFEKWDVVIASNNTSRENVAPIVLGDITINPLTRFFDLYGSNDFIRVSGSKRRLGSTDYSLTGLDKKTHDQIKKNVEKGLEGKYTKKGNQVSPTQNMYFNTGVSRNPLIVIYPIVFTNEKKLSENANENEKEMKRKIDIFRNSINIVNCGISIGIPEIIGMEHTTYDYVINKVYQMELISGTSNISDWSDEFDEDNEDLLDD